MDSKQDNCSYCGIESFTEIVRDRWTTLIIRDIGQGKTKFDEIQKNIGASTAIVSKRLNHLVHEGIVTKSAYQEAGKRSRYEYLLTPKGMKLGLVLIAMAQFSYDNLATDENKIPQVEYLEKDTKQPIHLGFINQSGNPVAWDNIEIIYNK